MSGGRGDSEFKGANLPMTWMPGWAGLIAGPVDKGVNRCTQILFYSSLLDVVASRRFPRCLTSGVDALQRAPQISGPAKADFEFGAFAVKIARKNGERAERVPPRLVVCAQFEG